MAALLSNVRHEEKIVPIDFGELANMGELQFSPTGFVGLESYEPCTNG